MKDVILTLMGLAILSGCATKKAEEADPVRASVQQSLGRIDSMAAHTKGGDAVKEAPAPQLSGSLMTVSFQGDALRLLDRLAQEQNKQFVVRGPRPYLPLFVVLEVKNASFEEVLTNVGAQFGQRADLVLTNQTLEVRFRGQN